MSTGKRSMVSLQRWAAGASGAHFAPRRIGQAKLVDGKSGRGSRAWEDAVEAKVSNDRKTIHSGKPIGGDCNIILAGPVFPGTFRLHIPKLDACMDLNSFELDK